jgi:hypothetical protein
MTKLLCFKYARHKVGKCKWFLTSPEVTYFQNRMQRCYKTSEGDNVGEFLEDVHASDSRNVQRVVL